MAYPVKAFVKECTATFIDDVAWGLTTVTRPARALSHEIEAVLLQWECGACNRLRKQISRANIQRQFVELQNTYANSRNPKKQLTYLFLISIDLLPNDRRDATMIRAIGFIKAGKGAAINEIAEYMRVQSRKGLLGSGDGDPLLLNE